MPWAGGLNSPLLQEADLNGDGQEELIAYDRSSQAVLVFEWDDGKWMSRQELACLLPPGISGWLILQDYDKDGQKDMFTYTSAGIKVYRNTSIAGESATWELAAESLSYESNERLVNLLVNSGDLPAIEDVDGDGDTDVLVFDPSGGGGLQFYRNQSMERRGESGHFLFTLESRHWGGLSECNCGEYAYNAESCGSKEGAGHRVMHTGGKSLLLFDVDGDGDYDLLNGFEVCEELYYLENKGSNTAPLFNEFKTTLPGVESSGAPGYPAAFAIDADRDGVQDLIVSSQLNRNSGLKYDFSRSVWWYRPSTEGSSVSYFPETKAFLQEYMADFGEWSVPAFADLDGDGDQDMLLGSYGRPQPDGFYAGLMLFTNTGSAQNPSFELQDEDYLGLKKLRLMQLQPQFAGFSKDGSLDLVLVATETESFRRKGYLFRNSAPANAPFNLSAGSPAELPFSFSAQFNPFFYDVNGDALPDLLSGKTDGSLSLYENTGSADSPSFGQEVRNYLGLELDNYRRPLIPSVGDLSGNGQADLLLADGSGSIRFVEGFLEAGNLTEPKDLLLCENWEGAAWLGKKSWPVVVQLHNNEPPRLVVGNLNGGLWMFKTEKGPVAPEGEGLVMNVFPNPVNPDAEEVFVRSNMSVEIQLLSIRGQVLSVFQIPSGVKVPLPVEGFAPGVYIVKAEGAAGKLSRKFILLK